MMNQNSPRISVITPAYNVGSYIGEAIDSVLRQSFRDFEYIIVDDGSTDDTATIASRGMSSDPRIRVIQSDHSGASAARNLGLSHARGEFIAFLDGDDRWHSEFLRELLVLLESADSNVAAVFARCRVMSEVGRVYLVRWQRAGRYDFDDMLIDSCPPRTGSSLLIRKKAFDIAGVFDATLESAQDLEMWLRIQIDSGMPYFIGSPKYLLDIRVRGGAISRDHKKRFIALERIIRENAPKLRRSPRELAYVRAAVFAFRVGEEEFGTRWAQQAGAAGVLRLIGSSYGRKLIGWSFLSTSQRDAMRRFNWFVRWIAGRIIGLGSRVMH
jgi:glycosyltransferase involved in cell wall biosynthesis